MTLPIVDATKPDVSIGELTAPFFAAASFFIKQNGTMPTRHSVIANDPKHAFIGGLPTSASGAAKYEDIEAIVKSLDPSVVEKYYVENNSGIAPVGPKPAVIYMPMVGRYNSGYYGAGIPAGHNVTLNLNDYLVENNVDWRAKFPVTVTFN